MNMRSRKILELATDTRRELLRIENNYGAGPEGTRLAEEKSFEVLAEAVVAGFDILMEGKL